MSTKRCPFCAEKIQARAIKCKHCGSSLLAEKSNMVQRRAMRGRTVLLVLVGTIVGCFVLWLQEPTEIRGCHPSGEQQEDKKTETPRTHNRDDQADVPYSIIESNIMPGIKRSLDVRLSRKVSETALRDIALKLKEQDRRRYESTFICYYLPGTVPGHGAWATTHFDPDLEVRIQGSTIEQEESLRQLPDDPLRERVGSWLDEGILARRILIFKRNGRLFMEDTWKDGSVATKEIVEKPSGTGRTFEKSTGGGSAGEYYLIDSQGDLQTWDREGAVSTARKME